MISRMASAAQVPISLPLGRDRGQRRHRGDAEIEIVEADDRDVVGHAQAAALALEQRSKRQVVVAGEHRGDVGHARQHLGEQRRRPSSTSEGRGDGATSPSRRQPELVHGAQIAGVAAAGARIAARRQMGDLAVALLVADSAPRRRPLAHGRARY